MIVKTESKLEKLLSQGKFVVTGELGPPKHASADKIIAHARILQEYIDAVNLTDNQTAIVRLSSIAAAVHVLKAGVEPIMQMTCRDRNRIALQSDLLGAYSLEIRNVLCLSGDHQTFGNHPSAKNVYDLDSLQTVKMVKDMRDKRKFLCGETMEKEPRFYIGAVANPFADPFEFRVIRLEKKINAGADFIQTQAIFDMDRFNKWMDMVRERGLHQRAHIIAGLMPLKSSRVGRYINNHVPGIIVPEPLINRIEKAENAQAEGIKIIVEQIKYLRQVEGIKGVHIMAVNWEEVVPEIVKKAGLYPRPSIN